MKNIESSLKESRTYKPNPKFASNSNVTKKQLDALHKNYQNDLDVC